MSPRRPRRLPLDPASRAYAEQRAHDLENRVADRITEFAGSMRFVYLHIIWFSAWFLLGVEEYPYGLLTMIVSLESIFLSTFVMISQNRGDERRQVLADDRWRTVQHQEEQNEELLRLSRLILAGTPGERPTTDQRPEPARIEERQCPPAQMS